MQAWLNLVNTKCADWAVKPSYPDDRDWPLSAIMETSNENVAASLRHYNRGILNQYQSPLCAAYAIIAIVEAYYKLPPGTLSRRFVYWQAKLIDGIPDKVGTTLRAVLQVVHKIGACPESLCPSWPDWSTPTFTAEMFAAASAYKIKAYARLKVGTLDEIEAAIASGRMVLIGSMVTATDWADGWIEQPEGAILGGHATVLDEYNRNLTHNNYKRFDSGPNSWGTDWGLNGFYQMSEYAAEFVNIDYGGMHMLMEAWAVEFDEPFIPLIPDQTYQFDVAPVILNGRTMVELRSICKITGATNIAYDSDDKRVTLTYPDHTATMWIGKKEYIVS